jgi:prolyl-tRNA synthetase
MGLHRGIEVGHVFKLGAKYSEPMGCSFLNEDGKETTMIMGCYGIGISRVLAAAIEQNHDADGIKFPPPIAPFEAIIVCLDPGKPEFALAAESLYERLRERGLDVLLDDRDERPGVKFKDADLLGAPMQLVVGAKGVARGVIEVKDRRSGEKSELPVTDFDAAFDQWRATVYSGWNTEFPRTGMPRSAK